MSEVVDKLFSELPEAMKEQALITNDVFRKMLYLQDQIRDLAEQMEIVEKQWKREDRIWKDMVKKHSEGDQCE